MGLGFVQGTSQYLSKGPSLEIEELRPSCYFYYPACFYVILAHCYALHCTDPCGHRALSNFPNLFDQSKTSGFPNFPGPIKSQSAGFPNFGDQSKFQGPTKLSAMWRDVS